MGGGWLGGGWQGGGWQGGGWQGGGWQGGGWAGGGGSEGMYAMRPDRPLVAEDVSTTPPPAALLHAAPDHECELASPHILRDEACRSRRRSGDDASEASVQ